MIKFGNFSFAAPPRCGNTWVLSALAAAGLGERNKAYIHIPWQVQSTPYEFRISVVRHPCDWFESYMGEIFPGSVGVPEVDVFQSIDKFSIDHAVGFYLEHLPGKISEMFLAYRADTFLSHKNLTESFIEFLDSTPDGATEKQRHAIRMVPPENVIHPNKKLRMNRNQRRAMMQAESKMMDIFEMVF